MLFEITDAEHSSGYVEHEKLEEIYRHFSEQGFAVVSGLIPNNVCKELHDSMLEDVQAVRSKDKLTQHEKVTGKGHLQLGPRRHSPYVHSEVLANPLIEHVVARILGPSAWLGFYNGNVNCPNSETQPLHFDRPFAWPTKEKAEAAGQSWPPPSITVSCSIALSDITTETGATEIYPGTHKEVAVTKFKKGQQPIHYPELVEKWSPSARMEIPAGGVCFRDPRMWHRGIPNPSNEPRPMPALTYHSALAQHQRGTLVELTAEQAQQCSSDLSLKQLDDGSVGDGRLFFDESAKTTLESVANLHGINRNIRFVTAPKIVNHFLDAHLLGGARISEDSLITPYPER
jgi:hypothetical protein